MERSQRAPVGEIQRCAYCGYEISATPVRATSGMRFCSERCRDAFEADDEPFAGHVGFKQFRPGVRALDVLLPWGMPANSFVLLAGHEGIRHRGLQTELVWRALTRGECGIVVTYVDPPEAIVEHFLTFGWNVLPYLESGDLHIIDCFTNRLRRQHRSPSQQVDWNEFLEGFLDGAVTVVSDTTNLRAMESSLHETLKEKEMVGTGLVILDSLNEIEHQGHQLETEQFIKEVRGDVCNRKFVPIFAGTTVTENEEFVQNHTYLFDGIVDMQRNESIVQNTRIRQLGVRKMDGVRYRPQWAAYENTGDGFEIYDPQAEFESRYGDFPDDTTT